MIPDFRIVTLCGSAGALSAYVEILRAVPAHSGMAFVVLTHRRIETPCWLVQILSHETGMHVEEIADGMVLHPDSVYIGPAGMDLTTDGDALWLAPASKLKGWPNTFDLFLNSVAQNTLGRAVTVILSGQAKDGSAALELLKTNGGMNYAQSDASSDSMPRSAIATGNVDYVGSPGEIIADICKLPPLLDVLKIVRAIARELPASHMSATDDLPMVQARLLSSQVLIEEGRALIGECREAIRNTKIAINKSQALLWECDQLIARMGTLNSAGRVRTPSLAD